MDERPPAEVYALVIGLTLVVAGIVGFFYTASFSTGDSSERDAVLGILDVNGWHNLLHIASGAIGLFVAASYRGARIYASGSGSSTWWWLRWDSSPAPETRSSTSSPSTPRTTSCTS
jgi:hypothetical protein